MTWKAFSAVTEIRQITRMKGFGHDIEEVQFSWWNSSAAEFWEVMAWHWLMLTRPLAVRVRQYNENVLSLQFYLLFFDCWKTLGPGLQRKEKKSPTVRKNLERYWSTWQKRTAMKALFWTIKAYKALNKKAARSDSKKRPHPSYLRPVVGAWLLERSRTSTNNMTLHRRLWHAKLNLRSLKFYNKCKTAVKDLKKWTLNAAIMK